MVERERTQSEPPFHPEQQSMVEGMAGRSSPASTVYKSLSIPSATSATADVAWESGRRSCCLIADNAAASSSALAVCAASALRSLVIWSSSAWLVVPSCGAVSGGFPRLTERGRARERGMD